MSYSLRRAGRGALGLILASALGVGLAACGSINVPSDEPNSCSSDDDCTSTKFCRVGSCDTSSGQCTFTVTAGSCFVAGECYQNGQEKPGDRCSVCDPGLVSTEFVARSCPSGQTCSADSGQCKAADLDAVSDTTTDTTPDATADVEPDGTVDVVPDTVPDTTADTTPDTTTDTTPDTAPDTLADVAETDGGGGDCTNNDDCTALLGPGACETAICIVASGECVMVQLPGGSACTPAGGANNPCVKGTCDEAGACASQVLSNTSCDDGKACTLGDICVEGVCVGTAVVCSDDDPCTIDVCDPADGTCSSQPYPDVASVPCDDGNACTPDDVCVGGVCTGGTNECACDVDGDCVDDGNLCNGTPRCVEVEGGSKACVIDPATVIVCDTSGDSACEKSACDADTGTCQVSILAGAACDDGAPCTFGDKCDASGSCVGTEKVCNDDKVCTSDACVDGVCKFTPLTGNSCNPGTLGDTACFVGQCSAAGECAAVPQTGIGCNDESPCTLNDTCNAGVCQGTAKVCDDNNPCTTDSCSATTGECVFTPKTGTTACDDGDACTKDDTCVAGTCKGGASICQCTTDTDCADDGNLCNGVPKCVTGAGGAKSCVVDPGTVVTCSTAGDGPCEQTACVTTTGKCAKTPKPSSVVCDDANACTTGDHCSGTGTCVSGTPKVCDDSVGCTQDSCAPATGNCVFTPDGGKCDDGNPCTLDVCTPAGCSNQIAGEFTKCDDGDEATAGDFCFQARCVGGVTTKPSMSKCVAGGPVGLGVDGLQFLLGFSGVQGTGIACTPGQSTTLLSTLVSPVKVSALAGATGASTTMDGRAVFGPGPLVGLANGASASFSNELLEAVATLANSNFGPRVAVAAGPSYLLTGWDKKAAAGGAMVCTDAGKGWKCYPVGVGEVEPSKRYTRAAAARYVTSKTGGVTYAYALASQLDDTLSIEARVLESLSATVDPDKPTLIFSKPGFAGREPRGAVFDADGALYVFGEGGLFVECGTSKCVEQETFVLEERALLDAWTYSAGTVFLATDAKDHEQVTLYFLPKGHEGTKLSAFIRIDLPSIPGSGPLFIEGLTTAGIYIIGGKSSTLLSVWSMLLP
ncbi:MAG: hypothetical protein H6744_10520 [Deltaproteobacteria bacterium]|nr:hypothetical protein [Deltaproteobacteria bacterium]